MPLIPTVAKGAGRDLTSWLKPRPQYATVFSTQTNKAREALTIAGSATLRDRDDETPKWRYYFTRRQVS
jgi:hypothetical protein